MKKYKIPNEVLTKIFDYMNIKELNEIKYVCKTWYIISVDKINCKIKHINKMKYEIKDKYNYENIDIKFCKKCDCNINELCIDVEIYEDNIILELLKILKYIYNNNIILKCRYSYNLYNEIASYIINNTNIVFLGDISNYLVVYGNDSIINVKIEKNNKLQKLFIYIPVIFNKTLYLNELTIGKKINHDQIISMLNCIETEIINMDLITLLKFSDNYIFKGLKEIKITGGYIPLSDNGIIKIVNIINTNKIKKIEWDCYISKNLIEEISKSCIEKLYITKSCLERTQQSNDFDDMTCELIKLTNFGN